MEVTQFTYFQQVGGIDCKPITGEITYGLERLAMYLQGVDNVYDLVLDRRPAATATSTTRTRWSRATYNFEHSDVDFLLAAFDAHEKPSASA
jgi:glycyl-tRNA synthetase alpha chain